MLKFGRELAAEFYSGKDDNVFRELRAAVESCEKLYRSWDGKYCHDQINRYLGFFDDVGFYWRKGVLEVDIIDHLFGAYVIEAFEYDELRKYVSELRRTTRQETAFADFEALARNLEDLPHRRQMTDITRRGCTKR